MFLFSIDGGENNKSSWQKRDEICDKYYSDIYKYCIVHADISCAADITNDVFELFFKKWEKLKNVNYKSWLYETASNLIKNHNKKHGHKIKKETYIDDIKAEAFSYDQNFEAIFDDISDAEIEAFKEKIFENLSERNRWLYKVKYIEKLSSAEISEILSISENAVNQKIFRLREKIKAQISNIIQK